MTALNPDVALLLFILGALGVYLECLRPGWILPGVTGATLLVLSLASLAHCPIRWPAGTLAILAAACFGMAPKTEFSRVPILFGVISLTATAVLLTSPLIGIALGAPFAILTGFLLNAAISARRNKTEGRRLSRR